MVIPVNEIIKFINEHSLLALEVEGEATTEGALIDQYTDTEKDHQRWRLQSAGSGNEGFYNIENVRSAMSMEVVGASVAGGVEIVQRPYGAGPPHRQWKLVPVAGKEDVYKIENRNSGLVLDDVDGQKNAPASVKQYGSWSEDGRQQWKLIRVTTSGTTTPPPTTKTILRGPLYTWGYNSEGMLGDGTYTERLTPGKMPYLTGVAIKAISAGALHSLALLEDGTIQAWGSQDWYQLGNPTWADRVEPGAVLDLKGVKAISAGGWHNLALLEDGTVRAWGNDSDGRLGDGTASLSQYQPPVKVVDLERVTAVSAGGRHSLALLEDGTVWAWGSQSWFQLGNPIYADAPRPKKVLELDKVKAIAAGPWHSLALLEDGTLRGWGANHHGQFGGGNITESQQYQPPVRTLELEGVRSIAVGNDYSLALLNDGTVWAWGYNLYGQLGDGTTTNRNRPVKVLDLQGVKAIDAGGYHSMAAN